MKWVRKFYIRLSLRPYDYLTRSRYTNKIRSPFSSKSFLLYFEDNWTQKIKRKQLNETGKGSKMFRLKNEITAINGGRELDYHERFTMKFKGFGYERGKLFDQSN